METDDQGPSRHPCGRDRGGHHRAFAAAFAQVTPAAGYVPPDDKPSIKVGFTLFADYTYTDSPTAKNADGSDYNPNSFNVSRAYVNVTGQLHHLFSFRITPDIVRVTDATGTLSGSYALRLKYGFGRFNMDDWLPKGSWVRLGLQQTPYIDYAEGMYRYRFQSAIMVDRDGFLTSSDLGLSGHVNFPDNSATSTSAFTTARATARPKRTTRRASRSGARSGRCRAST